MGFRVKWVCNQPDPTTPEEKKLVSVEFPEDEDDDHPSPAGRGAGGEGKTVRRSRSACRTGSDHKSPLPKDLVEFARKLRKEQTTAERLLWRLLRNRQLANAKFRRQHAVDPYVLDFYCEEARLGIELDGGQHGQPEREARDETRTAFFASRNIRILRFWNREVFLNTRGCWRRYTWRLSRSRQRRVV